MSKTYGPTDIKSSVLDLIGNTPLISLERVYKGPGRILAKCEFLNPTGSIKDRSAYSMIKYAIEEGNLKPGAQIVEVTSGNQGSGIAMVGAVLQHPVTLVMSVGNSPQRAEMMRGLGANTILTPQVDGCPGSVTFKDVEVAREKGESLAAADPETYFVQQFANPNNCRAHYDTTGPEIMKQTGGHIDCFLATLGTAGSFIGVSRYLKEQNPAIQCVVVEPEGAEILANKPVTKPCHLLQGSGYGKIPDLFDSSLMDDAMAVSDEDAKNMKKELGEKEGLYVGYTSAANIVAAIRLAQSGKYGKDPWIVTLLNDTGLKYSDLYK